jgi:hypothetical protein
MDKIYIVEIDFGHYDETWTHTVGAFTDKSLADLTKEKWEKFYKEHSKLYDGLDSQKDFDKFYEVDSKYGDIGNFVQITIQELPFNVDNYSKINSYRTDEMTQLVLQWERDYRINQIIK